MFTNHLTGHTFESKLDWQKTMAVGNPHNLDTDTNLGIDPSLCAAAFVFADGMMIAKLNSGEFYSIVCQAELETSDPEYAIDWLWQELYL